MRAYVVAACIAWLACCFSAAFAAPAEVNPADLERLYNALNAPNATESTRQLQTEEGFLRFVAAPPGAYFTTGLSGAKSAAPELVAQAFISTNVGAFARPSVRMTFNTHRVSSGGDQSFVKLRQTYNGIPVVGGMIMVQTDSYGHAICVLSDVLRDTTSLDDGSLSITPSVGVTEAQASALAWARSTYGGDTADYTSTSGERMLYDPIVVGNAGSISLVWKFAVLKSSQPPAYEVVFVDAHSGQVVFHYPLIHDARNRKIYDGENSYTITDEGGIESNGKLVRSEGDPPTGIVDADLAYDFFGDTYDFYSHVHERDSIDNKGLPIVGTVRWCNPYFGCPVENAMYVTRSPYSDLIERFLGISPDHMYFGDGYASADDVVAHELTHGVTSYESDLIYEYQSGALNESFSDMWGEWIDLTNGRGNDTPAVRWLLGEDVPGGAIRNMKNPPEFGHPDRVGSPYYFYGSWDNGGVHTNSGVTNKLCYLLTDGDSFNGYTITGMGIEKTAKLFYELQVNLLTEASDFNDVYNALSQATINQGYNFNERANVGAAARAVEIAPDTSDELIKSFRAIPTVDNLGRPVISLTWNNPTTRFFKRVIVTRDTKGYQTVPTEGMEIYRGTAEKFLDTAVVAGTEYFYTIFAQLAVGFPNQRFTRAVAGTTPADFLTEAFAPGSTTPPSAANPFDLSMTQILFSPVGTPDASVGQSPTVGNYYSVYNVQVTKNISELPVARQDENGGSYALPLSRNQIVQAMLIAPFPFFGVRYDSLYLAANGYIAFRNVDEFSEENLVPSLASHFAIPRISFLFSDLAPNAFGEAWARFLDDKAVITFENIPEMDWIIDPPALNPNTVQVELFFSGHIRFTYLSCTAHNVIVGLSDGQGMPEDPALLFPGLQHVRISSNLSDFPQGVSAMTIEPIAVQKADVGEEVVFVAKTRVPAGPGVPVLSAEWNGPGEDALYTGTPPATQAPFADNHDGTGTFRWQTGPMDYGMYVVRIVATLGNMTAYQDVNLAVGITEPLPTATDVVLKTNNPLEDPRRDRPVDDDAQLIVAYNYGHPGEFLQPGLFAEGPTQILWFKNNALIPAFNNLKVVSPDVTKPNETWFYVVTPRTVSGLYGYPIEGMSQTSPVVTILSLPRIFNVVLPEDVPAGAPEGVSIPNLPAASGPATGDTTVVILGKRLSNPVSITFGGIDAQSFRSISQYRIEAATPAHAPSFVTGGLPIPEDVVVVTAAGPTTMQEAFTFVDTGSSVLKADVNHDGKVDAVDVQLVINAVLELSKSQVDADVNLDGKINAADLQVVINKAIGN